MPRSDGRALHVDFAAFTDTLTVARNAGVIQETGSRARIRDDFGYTGRRCAQIVSTEPGEEVELRLVRVWDAPPAVGESVLEVVFRAVIDTPVDLERWPILRCSTPEAGTGHPEAVGLELWARGRAAQGTYDVDVVSAKAILATAVRGLPQAAWTRFVLHRQEGRVHLYVGPPGGEHASGSFPDLFPEGEVYCIHLGNGGEPDSRGAGLWDEVRLGGVRQGAVAPAEGPVVCMGETAPGPPDALLLDSRKQLLVDDWSVAESRSIRRVFHRPQADPSGPVLRPDRPWEGDDLYPCGVMGEEDGRFRLWYWTPGATRPDPSAACTCLAWSPDGLHWEKPELGLHLHGGSAANNIVIPESGPCSLFHDPLDPRPERRYKAHLRGGGPTAWASPDGVHWSCQGHCLPQSLEATSVHLDPLSGRYLASVAIGWRGRRCRGYAESPDCEHWTDTFPMMDVDDLDDPGDEVCGLQVFCYEGLLLGLARIHHGGRGAACDFHLAVSHDGKHWQRPFRQRRPPQLAAGGRPPQPLPDDPHAQPFLPTGPAATPPLRVGDKGAISGGQPPAAASPAGPAPGATQLWFYHSGRPLSPQGGTPAGMSSAWPLGAIGLARLRVDGFASARAGADGGWLLTRPLRPAGQVLHVNAEAEGGELVVEAVDLEGRTLARSRPIREAGVDLACAWDGLDPFAASGGDGPVAPMRLRFQLQRAALYAFWCE
ncbi:MAG: hypothetical protein AB1505_16445 [Candidatus Latescibacterota bacterium]